MLRLASTSPKAGATRGAGFAEGTLPQETVVVSRGTRRRDFAKLRKLEVVIAIITVHCIRFLLNAADSAIVAICRKKNN
jgi:hypothetical protein